MNYSSLLSSTLLSLAAAVSAPAAIVTLPATGWTSDIVINNGGGPYDTTVNGTLDNGPGSTQNWTFGEAGQYLDSTGASVTINGLTAGTYVSPAGNGTSFTFQSFTANNALLLNTTTVSSATLTLVTPTPLASLALIGTTSGGPTSASVTLNFSDSTTSQYLVLAGEGIGNDWFQPDTSRALTVGGRVSNKSEEGFTRVFYQVNNSISLGESFFALSAPDQAKTVNSITVTNTQQGRLAVMAISGQAIPEPSALGLAALAGLLVLRRRR